MVLFFSFVLFVFRTSNILRGFWARGRVRGDRSVFVTSHRPAHSSRAHVFSLDRSLQFAFEVISCLPTCHPVAPPRL